jgi:putative transposase
MSRKHRMEFVGAIYHVFQRGNNREYIFQNEIEKSFFIKQLREYIQVNNYEILAFTIMNNHYHIIIRTNEASLSIIMHFINNIYGKYYNFHHNRTGHVFEERYKCKLVENDAYLIWLLRYIHRNPVRAHLCEKVEDYKWSSDNLYRCNRELFVNINFILDILSQKRSDAIKAYLQLVSTPEDEDKIKDYESIKNMYPNISSSYNQTEPTKLINRASSYRMTLDEILKNTCPISEYIGLIKSGSKKHHLTPIKIEFIKTAIDNKYTFKAIGEFIGVSQSAISRLLLDKGCSNYILDERNS